MRLKMNKRILFSILLTCALLASGCGEKTDFPIQDGISVFDAQTQSYDNIVLTPDSQKVTVIDRVVTDQKAMALTFVGIGDPNDLDRLLKTLSERNIKATFFVNGNIAVETPEILEKIIQAGHEIGNSTLNFNDLTSMDDQQKMSEIGKSRELILNNTGVNPVLLKIQANHYDDSVLAAAAACGEDYIIGLSMNPLAAELETVAEAADLVFERKHRGGIIQIDLDNYDGADELVAAISERLETKDYRLVPAGDLVPIYEERQENLYVLDEDWFNNPVEERNYIKNRKIGRYVALTFDDWGSDDTIDATMDILTEYGVPAMFFLRANGVELDPSLAYTIHARGFDVGNHTFNHVDLTTLSEEEIENEIILAHEMITQAMNAEPYKYLRPPFGANNAAVVSAAAKCGYIVVDYEVSAHDYLVENSAEKIAKTIVSNTKFGSIILLHILNDTNTREALPLIIEQLREKKYEFITVAQLIGDDPLPGTIVEDVTLDNDAYGVVTVSSLSIRSGRSTDYSRIGVIPKDGIIEVIEYGTEWSKIKYEDIIGYVSSNCFVLTTDLDE